MTETEKMFYKGMRHLRLRVHAQAVDKGFWEPNLRPDAIHPNFVAMKLALIHSEISEALEELRRKRLDIYRKCTADGSYHPYDSDICSCHKTKEAKKPEGLVVELADAVIRIMDLCEALNLPLEEALIMKAEYNETRPRMHGGKAL